MRTRTIAIASVALAAMVLGPVAPARAVDPVTVTFGFTGAEQSWVVPAGVTSIHAVLVGARGAGFGTGSVGGFGHRAQADVTVTPGATIYVEVGGLGSEGSLTTGGLGGFNGGGAGGNGGSLGEGSGGGGGGGTDLRTISRSAPGSTDSRLVIAGGGGGEGGGSNGGAGGNAGDAGGNSIGGGAIGGAPGFNGQEGCGGCGGNAGGQEGVMGLGGRGGNDPTSGNGDSGSGGGGGGGGYQGGGGGGGGPTNGAGGGGGSSFAGGWAYTNPNVAADTSGTSLASITYVPDGEGDPGGGSDTVTVDAVISMADAAVCIELSTSSVDFGPGRFGEVDVVGSPEIVVTNCSEVSVRLYARGTDATGNGAAWTLVNDTATCADTLGLDRYHLGLHENQADVDWRLGTTNTELEDIATGSPGLFSSTIDTACPGSSGAGQQMSMQIVFLATEAPE